VRGLRTAGLAVVIVSTVACSSRGTSSSPSSQRNPSDTVTAYYSAIGAHDASTAAELLAPEIRQQYQSGPDSDFTNVMSVTNIRDITEAVVSAPAIPAGYQDVTQVALRYDVVYKHVITEMSGTSTRFVYVGRTSSTAPWLIVSIGTGP
jgi:hypothetical protein